MRLARQRDVAVKIKPIRFEPRDNFIYPFVHHVAHAGKLPERRIGRQIPPVDRLIVFVENHFDDAIALVHRVEQSAIALIAFTQRDLGELTFGNVQVGREGFQRVPIRAKLNRPFALDPAQNLVVAEHLIINTADRFAAGEIIERGLHPRAVAGNDMFD